MKALFVSFVLLCMSVISGFAQQLPINDKPYIEVTGSAEKQIIPDRIYVEVLIQDRPESRNMTIADQEKALFAMLERIKVPSKQVQVSDLNSDFVQIKWRKKDVISQKKYRIELHSASVVGQLFLELDNLKVEDAQIVKIDHSQMETLKQELRIQAIQAAQNKANYLLTAIGSKVGKPMVVLEQEFYQPQPVMMNVRSKGYADDALEMEMPKIGGMEVEFKSIPIRSSIYVKFEIL